MMLVVKKFVFDLSIRKSPEESTLKALINVKLETVVG
jgi:hypothetical protein